MQRRTALALAALTAAVLLGGCTGPDRPEASDAAAALASALAAGDLDGIVLETETSADPQQHLAETTAPLREAAEASGVEPSVTVARTVVDEEAEIPTAQVTLAWSWPLTASATWEYSTETELDWVEPPEGSEQPGHWAVLWDHDLVVPGLGAGERLEIDRASADRGEILDVHGEPLVTERDVWRIGVDKTFGEADEWDEQARDLALLVGLDPDEYAARVESAGDKAFVEAITIRAEDSGVSFAPGEARTLAGVNVVADTMDLAPTSSFARPILGRSGEATAEIIEESGGTIVQGDVVGLSGLQSEYDVALRGADGLVVTVLPAEVDADAGEEPRELFRVDPTPGADVTTAFDPDLQVLAEEVLEDVESASAVVAIQPSTGDVLAAASGPGSEGWSTATLGQYAPGSTFKIVDALALLRSGVYGEDTVRCPDTLTVDGRTYSNVPGYPTSALGDVSLRTAFAHSCNTAFIGATSEVEPQVVVDAAADLGLTVPPGTGTASFLGEVPTSFSGTAQAEALIGQGEVLASPLGMATVAASVAAGEQVVPRIVVSVDGGVPDADGAGGAVDDGASAAPSGSSGPSGSPAPSAGTADGLTAGEAADLLDLMGAVVSEGSADELGDIPGVVGAKTGTAQYGDGSAQHAWMLAVADDLAVAVFVEDGEFGSTTAGPLMGRFLAGR
ncbi:penicillin-binding transpeptidase domain-containing protein [Isoptericola jiangsuensis]|uniref:penicillin-binding transpeptidase domain-containing protein n=1 Tax=Isoptericola jiangsuensis TaxID=548579 RepID=UPI003AAF5845